MQSRMSLRAALPVLLAAVGVVGAREAAAQREQRIIPQDTVVRVRLDDRITSRTAAVGDRFVATVSGEDRSGFPEGTRMHGTVTEVQRASDNQPGVVDMRFRRAVLPDGSSVQVEGRLASLSEEDVRRTRDGRLATRKRSAKFEPKWVGYGAGAGAVLATIFGGSFLKGALLGGLGGAVYAYLNKDKDRNGDRNADREAYREVELAPGTEFGVRLTQEVAFADRPNYRYTARDDRLDDERPDPDRRRPDDERPDPDRRRPAERVLGDRSEYRYGPTTVMFNGRRVEFGELRPVNINGTLYLPLRPIAQAANMRYDHRAGDDHFTLRTREGMVEAYTGETELSVRNQPEVTLSAAPMAIDGEVYVPTEYLNRVADMRVNWDRRNMRLELESYR